MFYLIKKEDRKFYIFDSSDSVTESFSSKEILHFVQDLGIEIKGIKLLEKDVFKFKIVNKPTIVFGKQIDNSFMDRDRAICIIDGKVYIEDNHQNCLDDYLLEQGTSLKEKENIDLGTDAGFEEACALTHGKFNSCEMYGWDIYKDTSNQGYLVAHFESNFIACYGWVVKYAYDNDLYLGTYCDADNKMYIAEVIDL